MSDDNLHPSFEARDPGAKPKRWGFWFAIGAFGFALLYLTFFYRPAGSRLTQARLRDAAVIGDCRKRMADPLLSASTREAHRSICNDLRDDYVRQYDDEP